MCFTYAKSKILPLVAAALFATALIFAQFYLAWICLAPLFVAIQDKKSKSNFYTGMFFGAVFGIIHFYWIIPAVTHFTGGKLVFGIIVYLIATLFTVLYFGILLFVFTILKRSENALWLDAVLMALLWVIGEWSLSTLFTGMPWFGFRAGNILARNLYAIQPAAYGGVFILSFFVIATNYVIARYCVQKQWKQLAVPVSIILLYMLAGYGIFARFNNVSKDGRSFSVAILCENTTPDLKWSKENGDLMAAKMLQLNARLVRLKPDIAIWTESAVPWTYSPDDDFIKEVIKTTAPSGIAHMIGINTEYKNDIVYNSAYYLLPDGRVAGRYDKRFLLSLVEQPLALYALPFLSTDGFYAKAGNDANPVATSYGQAGILICNEVTVEQAARDMVDNGAEFLVNMSNDGWFCKVPYLVNQHFLNARLRSVEVRKDMIINSNLGISGKVSAGGQVDLAPVYSDGFVAKFSLTGNNYNTFYTEYHSLFLGFMWFGLVLFSVRKIKIK